MDDIDYDNEMFGDSHNQLVTGLQDNRSLHCKYYGEEDLNEGIVHTNSFSLIHFNARSLSKNFNAIILLQSLRPAWLEDNCTNAFDIDGYQVKHTVKDNKRGGGCSIYESNVIKFNLFKPLCTSCDDVFDCVAVEVQNKSRNIIVGCLYRPPGGIPSLNLIIGGKMS